MATEAALIARARAGDLSAFDSLVRLRSAGVMAALRSFGLTPDEAEEVAQEVFVRAWRGLARFEGRALLSTWLYRIAYNEAQRRMARRDPPRVPLGPDGEDPLDALPAPGPTPEAHALAGEFEVELVRALSTLPEEWRVAVVLRDVEGLSTTEAAAAVGLGEAAFKSRVHRGRMALRAALEPYLLAAA